MNTVGSLIVDLAELGLRSNMTVMAHCSLKQVGWTEGGPNAVIRVLMDRNQAGRHAGDAGGVTADVR